ncbi:MULTISPECIES: hypothetical protein [unclassified Lentimonas]|uniref:hypothetical protein n=1 Tax=unclassified Lentimonas TaxID=2630993 RepID=UPI0013234485|nr:MULTISPECIES: hypothetical protein [unclassified Lentimonas]CAA6693479.1 Unannotated [Lentimonas sp. CC19]CAA6695825.1 Unannotated [Lentimonas sp. CC10]CAA7069746.1 Unannotated [Lentimonas sp. CC11]
MDKTKKALKTLKRNLYGTILLTLLLPIYYWKVLKEDPSSFAAFGVLIIWLSSVNLSYTSRVEKALKEEAPEALNPSNNEV